MDNYISLPIRPTAKVKGSTEQLAHGGEGQENLIQKSAWKDESGNGTRSGRAEGTKTLRKHGKPPRPPKSPSVASYKIQKPHNRLVQCEIVFRRSKTEGECFELKRKLDASSIIFSALSALLVTVCFLLFVVGSGISPNHFLTFGQIKALRQIIHEKLLITGLAEFKVEPEQSKSVNLRTLEGYSVPNSLNPTVGKLDRPKGGSQMNMAGIQLIKRDTSKRNPKLG